MTIRTGVTSNTVKHLLLDAGAVYINYGEVDERLLGATRDGNSFVVEQDIREIPIDGLRGPLKGARRVIAEHARLTCNLMELTTENLLIALPGAAAEDYPAISPTHKSITRSIVVPNDAYFTNLALVGQVAGSDEPLICIIYNALADGNFELSTTDQEEAAIELQFTAHFDVDTLQSSPWEIRAPIIA